MNIEFRWIMFGDCVEIKNVIIPNTNTYVKKQSIYKINFDNDKVNFS